MSKFRKMADKNGLSFINQLKFHQTRATFGTWLMETALRVGDAISAIAFVRDAMLHKHESTTLKYVKFLSDSKMKHAAADAFSEVFSGVKSMIKKANE